MGYNVSGRESNAGKIGYGLTTTNALDVYGAGTVAGAHNLMLWDNVTTTGAHTVSDALNVAGATSIGGNTTITGSQQVGNGLTVTAGGATV
jgi:hypothetical protein